jgi:hypothetical protein
MEPIFHGHGVMKKTIFIAIGFVVGTTFFAGVAIFAYQMMRAG